MNAQLDLFTDKNLSRVVAFLPASNEAQGLSRGTEGNPMSIRRQKAPLEETLGQVSLLRV